MASELNLLYSGQADYVLRIAEVHAAAETGEKEDSWDSPER